jgi:predicted DNA-binding protein with PD1-like motif
VQRTDRIAAGRKERQVKSKLIQDGGPKTFVLVFEAGEEVLAGLLRFAKEQKLEGAHLTAIGAFERATLGFFEFAKKAYKKIPVEEQVELLSLVGNIAIDDTGEPKLHAHVVVGKADGTAHGGHLLEAHVRPTLEVVLVESSKELRRRTRADFGVALLDLT